MSHPAVSPSQKRLDAIRNRIALASLVWGMTADGDMTITAGAGALGAQPVAIIDKDAAFGDAELFCHAPDDLTWLLKCYGEAVKRIRELRAELDKALEGLERFSPKAPDYAAECAMKCTDAAFKKYFEERHSLERPLTDERVKIRVRHVLDITSRADLNKDPAAADRWKSLRADFEQWRKA